MRHTIPFVGLVAVALSLGAACGSSDGDAPASGRVDRRVAADFAAHVVVPTYTVLTERTIALESASRALAGQPSEATLAAAREAWRRAREPWEQSEAFAFGPSETFGYDPALDSWPLATDDLDALLASSDPVTPERVASLPVTAKGFHAVEYLLFCEARSATSLSDRELALLVELAGDIAQNARALAQSWMEGAGGAPPYQRVLATAGDADNSAYPSVEAAAKEILNGMVGICDELATAKIGEPLEARDPRLLESPYAASSIVEYQDNLRSVENAYTASVPLAGTRGRGLSAVVAERDAELDARVRREIAAAIAALGAIPGTFGEAIMRPEAHGSIEAALAAIRTLQGTLERDVTPLVVP